MNIEIMRFNTVLILLISAFSNLLISQDYDLIILNGSIYDGSGSAPYTSDLGIKGLKIISIGKLNTSSATKVIDATELALSPGFIDLHAHLEPILQMPGAESHVRQGVTLALGGPDGGSLWPFGEELEEISKKQLGMNVAFLAGHNTIRKNIMNLDNREPTPEELDKMKSQVAQAMEEGAFGLSTGLKYLPGTFSKVDEVIELAKVAARYGGFYTSHLREEGLGLIDAVKEAIMIGKEANIPVVLTHHKAIGKPSWGKSVETLKLVDEANRSGLDIQIDQYPYTASYTSLSVLIPSWALEGGREDFTKRVHNSELRDSIKNGIIFNIMNDRGSGDLKRIQFGKVDWYKDLEGKTLEDWCRIKKIAPTPENGADLIIEAEVNGGAGAIFHAIDDADVDRIMKHPKTMIASDGRLSVPGYGHPHPRAYGTFPRVLGHYVRERKLLTLEEAIHKMTLLPALRLGLKNRGFISAGNFADLVIFDPKTVKDKSTYEAPHQYPEGILYVIVNGTITVDNGTFTENRAGKVIYGPAKKP
ncbi:MAG: D-aminoacylase [Saprospiraceae bacterium]|jgi:dihydroorotase/N-acyl-D-amino-acid deacylase